jgi:hypothetical protein
MGVMSGSEARCQEDERSGSNRDCRRRPAAEQIVSSQGSSKAKRASEVYNVTGHNGSQAGTVVCAKVTVRDDSSR